MGIPKSVTDTLFCEPNSFTLLFEADVVDGVKFVKRPYPIPACMVNDGKLKGEIIITLVYAPPVDGRHGDEYCRANIDVSFGRYSLGEDGKYHHHKEVPLDAPKSKDEMYEKALIEHGFKWSPVKVYRRKITRGIKADSWRLTMEVIRRAWEPKPGNPQQAVVLVTLRSLSPSDPVYDDGKRALVTSGWVSEEITQGVHVTV